MELPASRKFRDISHMKTFKCKNLNCPPNFLNVFYWSDSFQISGMFVNNPKFQESLKDSEKRFSLMPVGNRPGVAGAVIQTPL